MEYKTLTLTQSGHRATVTLNRPEMRNAFNEQMLAELTQVFGELGQREALRAVVLAANGPAFCAGGDLNWMKEKAQFSEPENHADALVLAEMLHAVYLCPLPVVARVHGHCFGGGMGLAAACDIVVAVEAAQFCLSEVRLGLIPAGVSPYVLKAIGEQAARRYFLTAERFDGRQAQRLGLVHELASADTLDATVEQIVGALAANGPQAVRQAKVLVREVAGVPITDYLLDDTAARLAQIRASSEGREGVQAFLDKRAPAWLAN